MSKKRGNNEGSIYKRPNGRWRAQITVGGGRVGYTAETKAEALAWLREMGAQVDRGLTLKAAHTKYDEFLTEWLKTSKGRLTFDSWRSYTQVATDYIRPTLGSIKLRELTPIQIQRLYNQQLERGIGKRTIQKTHAVIRASLNAAKTLGLVPSNPANAARPPKSTVREMSFLNAEQVKHLLDFAKETNSESYALIYLAVVTGMRQGELLALRWPEVDTTKGILQVKASLKRVPGEGLQPQKPKTKSSIRSIKLGRDTCEVLEQQRVMVANLQRQANSTWQDLGFVFPEKDGSPIEPAEAYRDFQELLKNAGLPKVRFHDLRHTAASLMLSHGVDVLIVSKRLGHAKPSITLDYYGHLVPNIQNEAASVIENLVR